MLTKTYSPLTLETHWRSVWEGLSPEDPSTSSTKPSFCLIMPPPNVTGSLHLGHALTFTLQDIWVRFWRMRGGDVLMQPGLDHAGIATQMVVERQLGAQGIRRHDLGREGFLERVWAWKESSGGTILEQLRRLGVSADWERTRFTLDPEISTTVRQVFIDLWKAGLIYRDKRLVNWDPALQTALSDLEVVAQEIAGTLWQIHYPLVSEDGKPEGVVTVATTRPETLFGDQAVAVHPDDPRYQGLVGRRLKLPLMDREIPLIFDESVDPEKGTGAVKITPAHDFHDFEIGRRHGLALLTILDERGMLNENVPPAYRGISRESAREKALVDLRAQNLLGGEEAVLHAVPHGDRSGIVLEPRLTDQWYLNAAVLAAPALKAWEEGKLRFFPENYGEVYAGWMRNIQPWCLSRQLWWGHPIPAWYGPDGHPFVGMDLADAHAQARAHYGKEVVLVPDEDVLDTWFSSALWPLVTLGWPANEEELSRYYPSDVLVTGFDIIFFWVARMVMMGVYFRKETPFRDVYIHGLLRDAQRQKMSKSKGNVVDPLELMEHYGADALRLTLAAVSTPGRDMAFDPRQVEGSRNFITKLWNATRFCLMKGCSLTEEDLPSLHNSVNQWLVHEIAQLVGQVTLALEAYKFYEAASLLYHFVWGTYCDWYIELAKGLMDGETPEAAETRFVAGWGLGVLLHLLHPFIPFVTEELWAALAPQKTPLVHRPWPLLPPLTTKGMAFDVKVLQSYAFAAAKEEVTWLIELMSAVRSVRAEQGLPPGQLLRLQIFELSERHQEILGRHEENLKRLLKLSALSVEAIPLSALPEAVQGGIQVVLREATLLLPLEGIVDLKAEQERLAKTLEKIERDLLPLKARLASKDFVERAAAAVVVQARERVEVLQAEHQKTQEALARLRC